MGAREEFVVRAQQKNANISELCREYGVSRKTVYKWLERFKEQGFLGLEDQSRAPKHSPQALDGATVTRIVALRHAHPSWGAKKIAEILRREAKGAKTPSTAAVHRALLKAGLLQPGRRRRRPRKSNAPSGVPRPVAKRPNDLWTVDFKGWWLSMDKQRCEPLTVRDAYSRFLLDVRIVDKNSIAVVQPIFEGLFKKYGLPKAILTDNGTPWVASQGELGLTKLSTWWTSLGIVHYRTRVAKPSDNGGHERMHRDIEAEVDSFKELARVHQQEACDRWRHDFNRHRPHEALKMKVPAEVYKRSDVDYEKKPTEFVYPDTYLVRTVSKRGHVSYVGMAGFLSLALTKYKVGLQPITRHVFDVWLYGVKLGRIDFTNRPAKLQPISWTDTSLSPMSA